MSARGLSTAIGGSDVSAIRGENNYKTAMDVWKRIVRGVPESPAGLAAALGVAAEEPILCDYCERHGKDRASLERTVEVFLKDEPHFRGELDGLFRADRVALDAKLVLSPEVAKQWGDDGTDFMPTHILNQQAWYAMLADLDHVVVVGVLFGRPRDLIYRRVPDYEAMLLEDARRFWTDHVLTGIPPQPQTVGDAVYLYPQNKSEVRPATEAEAALVADWRAKRDAVSHADVELEQAKALVCAAIGDSDGLWLGGNDRVHWKANKNGVRSLKG